MKRCEHHLQAVDLQELRVHARGCAPCNEHLDSRLMLERVLPVSLVSGPTDRVRDAMWKNIDRARVERRFLPSFRPRESIAAVSIFAAVAAAAALIAALRFSASMQVPEVRAPEKLAAEMPPAPGQEHDLFDPLELTPSMLERAPADLEAPIKQDFRESKPTRAQPLPVIADRTEPVVDAAWLLESADTLRRAGQLEEAAAIYQRVAALDHADAYAEEAMLREARIEAQLQQSDAALEILARAHLRFPRGGLVPERAAFTAKLQLERDNPSAAAAALDVAGCEGLIIQRARREVADRLAKSDPRRARALTECLEENILKEP